MHSYWLGLCHLCFILLDSPVETHVRTTSTKAWEEVKKRTPSIHINVKLSPHVQSPHKHMENCFLIPLNSFSMKNNSKGKFYILLSDKLALLLESDAANASKAL